MNLELSMSAEDVSKVILEWAEKEFPGKFNRCRLENTYRSPFAELTFEQPEESDK